MLTNWIGAHEGPIWIKPGWSDSSVRALFSFRQNGESDGDFRSLNVGLHVNDEIDKVLLNRRICAEELGEPLERWVVAEQVHGNKVAVIDENHQGMGAFSHAAAIGAADALITNRPDIALVVLTADCVPILFYDPVQKVIGTAHSGWKGTLSHIAVEVVRSMQDTYRSNPADIQVCFGPSIRRCCYEVNEVVAEPMQAAFGTRVMTPRFRSSNRWMLSLQDSIRLDLLTSGVRQENIADSGVCTACRTSVLFSHRSERGKTGRLLGAICIK